MHEEPHELMGLKVKVATGPHAGREGTVIDWWDHRVPAGWKQSAADGVPPAMVYQARVIQSNEKDIETDEYVNEYPPLPDDDDVLQVRFRDTPHPDGQGMIQEDIFIHASELEDAAD